MKKHLILLSLVAAALSLILLACQKELNENHFESTEPLLTMAEHKIFLDVPAVTCDMSTNNSIDLLITAGASGAPSGFTVQWMKLADYEANGYRWADSLSICSGSFSGKAKISRYNLETGQSVTVNIGDFVLDNGASFKCTNGLDCGTVYIFRAFAHATKTLLRSSFSENLTCSTLGCI